MVSAYPVPPLLCSPLPLQVLPLGVHDFHVYAVADKTTPGACQNASLVAYSSWLDVLKMHNLRTHHSVLRICHYRATLGVRGVVILTSQRSFGNYYDGPDTKRRSFKSCLNDISSRPTHLRWVDESAWMNAREPGTHSKPTVSKPKPKPKCEPEGRLSRFSTLSFHNLNLLSSGRRLFLAECPRA